MNGTERPRPDDTAESDERREPAAEPPPPAPIEAGQGDDELTAEAEGGWVPM